jgi:hypothetical protein
MYLGGAYLSFSPFHVQLFSCIVFMSAITPALLCTNRCLFYYVLYMSLIMGCVGIV